MAALCGGREKGRMEVKRLMTIAGSDSGGGAGIQADLKTFAVFGVYGMSVVTAVTAQNTQRVGAILPVSPELVSLQIRMVTEDIGVDGIKTGMLGDTGVVEAVSREIAALKIPNVVVDPVMVAKSGDTLLRKEAVKAMTEFLLPLAQVVTPNLPEASILAGIKVESIDDIKKACRRIKDLGPRHVLVKGGHLPGEDIVDILFDGEHYHSFPGKRIHTTHTHGTGCTFSAALCALSALGYPMVQAVTEARRYMELVLAHALALGKGHGPTNHLAPLFLLNGKDPMAGGKMW